MRNNLKNCGNILPLGLWHARSPAPGLEDRFIQRRLIGLLAASKIQRMRVRRALRSCISLDSAPRRYGRRGGNHEIRKTLLVALRLPAWSRDRDVYRADGTAV